MPSSPVGAICHTLLAATAIAEGCAFQAANSSRAFEGAFDDGFVEHRRVEVIKTLKLETRDFGADKTLDGFHMRVFLGNHDCEGFARVFRPSRASDAVDVILGVLRHNPYRE